MGIEIERKFLVADDGWRSAVDDAGAEYVQGYLSRAQGRTVRVRTEGRIGMLTIKGETSGFSRKEFEYEIPLPDAQVLLEELCERPLIRKIRYCLHYQGFLWEIDEFHEENEGLILAEIELSDEGQSFSYPDWLGKEVTGDPRYYNASLVQSPYRSWDNGR